MNPFCADIPICADDVHAADAPRARGDSELDDFAPYYDPTLGPPGAPADIRRVELGGTSPSRHADDWDEAARRGAAATSPPRSATRGTGVYAQQQPQQPA